MTAEQLTLWDERELCLACLRGDLPSHNPSPRCESGRRPHCTCDTCF